MVRNSKTLRYFDNNYVRFGYSYEIDKKNIQLPVCLICGKVRKNGSMNPAKLRQHFETSHRHCGISYEDLKTLHQEQLLKNGSPRDPLPRRIQKFSAHLSYIAAYLTAKTGMTYGTAEKILKPFLVHLFEAMNTFDIKKRHISPSVLSGIPLSRQTMKKRVVSIAQDLEDQMLFDLKASPTGHALQTDSSTDIDNLEQLMAFGSYEARGKMMRELLFCKEVGLRATADANVTVIRKWYEENEIPLAALRNNTADGCATNFGVKNGILVQLQRSQPAENQADNHHCALHKVAIASKFLTPPIKTALDNATKVINFVKNSALNVRLLRQKAIQQQLKHDSILFYRSVRWLSLGLATERLSELEPLILELIEYKAVTTKTKTALEMNQHVKSPNFWEVIAYLADLFATLNSACRRMQGDLVTFFTIKSAIQDLVVNLETMIKSLASNNSIKKCTFFKNLKKKTISQEWCAIFKTHLTTILKRIKDTCIDDSTEYDFVENPFTCDETTDEILLIRNSPELLKIFLEVDLYEFWVICETIAPTLSLKARQFLNAFPTSYMCERAFSIMNHLKSKKRNRLDVQHQLRIKMTSYVPRWEKLIAENKTRRSRTRVLDSDDEDDDTTDDDEGNDEDDNENYDDDQEMDDGKENNQSNNQRARIRI